MTQQSIPTVESGGFVPYVFRERYIWIEARHDSDLAGIAIEARVNLVHGELRDFLERIAAIEDERERIRAAQQEAFDILREERAELTKTKEENEVEPGASRLAGPEERKLLVANGEAMQKILREAEAVADQLDRKTWHAVSPYIRDWNIFVADDDGEYIKVPPPAEDPDVAFDAINGIVVAWVILTVATAYKSGKGLSAQSTSPNGTARPEPERKTATRKARK